MAERSARRWLALLPAPLLVSLLVGLVLSIVSVPVAAIIAQFGSAYAGQGQMFSRSYSEPDGTHYLIGELLGVDANSRAQPPNLMRLRSVELTTPFVGASGPKGVTFTPPTDWSDEDPRPPFLRRPPASGFMAIEAYSAGWPMHAAHSIAHLPASPTGHVASPGIARREHGLLRFAIAGKDFVIPVLPISTGLLGNTLLYGGTLLLAWWLLRGRRIAKRRARGECLACGYPLDGDMERCPECGAPNKHRLQTPSLARRPPPPPPTFVPGG